MAFKRLFISFSTLYRSFLLQDLMDLQGEQEALTSTQKSYYYNDETLQKMKEKIKFVFAELKLEIKEFNFLSYFNGKNGFNKDDYFTIKLKNDYIVKISHLSSFYYENMTDYALYNQKHYNHDFFRAIVYENDEIATRIQNSSTFSECISRISKMLARCDLCEHIEYEKMQKILAEKF